MKRVLVCDDDLDILDILDYALTDSGWEVVKSYTVDDILDKVERAKPSVIIMDNWIPSVGGIEATRTIKNHPKFKDIPVIYLTANNDIETLAQTAGADLALPKPFDLDNLTKTVEMAYRLKPIEKVQAAS
jgi:CheY-like chemotaxis protein